MTEQTTTEASSVNGAASALDVELGELVAELDAAKLYTSWGEESALPEDAANSIRKLHAANKHLRQTVAALARLSQHGDGCLGCDCGLDNLVLDGEPTDAAPVSPDAQVTGSPASSAERPSQAPGSTTANNNGEKT